MLRRLPVHLTEDERHVRAMRAAALQGEVALLEERKKQSAATYSEQLKELNEELRANATAARNGFEEREVEVNAKPNDDRLIVEFYRDDTGELVEQRPMTEDEMRAARQRSLPFRQEGPKAEAPNLRAVGAATSIFRGDTRNGTTK